MQSDKILSVDNEILASLVHLLPDDQDIASSVIAKLLVRDDVCLANSLFDRFPNTTISQIVSASNDGHKPVTNAWRRSLVRNPQAVLRSDVMREVKQASFLYELADVLNWLSPEVIAGGLSPWATTLETIHLDLSDEKLDTLHGFIIVIAFSAPTDGSQKILDKLLDQKRKRMTSCNSCA